MQEWQERVVRERDELQNRITKLDDFVFGYDDKFSRLHNTDQFLLMRQLEVMKQYLSLLDKRISLFYK